MVSLVVIRGYVGIRDVTVKEKYPGLVRVTCGHQRMDAYCTTLNRLGLHRPLKVAF
jgi:hypothetical protein